MILFVVFRILIGVIFIVSGAEKLIGPYQNFLFVVQSYDVFPEVLEEIIARTLPWIELLIGIFLALGLWTKISIRGALILFTGFIIIIAQAMVRELPISECGCFGELASFPLHVVLIFDSTTFFICFYLTQEIEQTLRFSLDKVFA